MNKISSFAAVALAAAALLTSTATAQADEFCPAGNVCFWKQDNFQGGKVVYGNAAAEQWYIIDGTNYRSIKNHLDNRAVWTAQSGGPLTCTNPGLNRSGAPLFIGFYIGPAGSRC